MTCGIYLLTFDKDIYYIGLSKDIEHRVQSHLAMLRSGEHRDKLQSAYNNFGSPKIDILEECSENSLPDREIYYIEKFNSYHKGLNSNKGGGTGPDMFNENKRKDLFIILKRVLLLYTDNKVTTERIAEFLNIDQKIIVDLLSGNVKYDWIRIGLEDLYTKAINIYKSNNCNKNVTKYPKIISIEGEVVQIPYRGAAKFARDRNINPSNLNKLLKGGLVSCSGWRLYYPL